MNKGRIPFNLDCTCLNTELLSLLQAHILDVLFVFFKIFPYYIDLLDDNSGAFWKLEVDSIHFHIYLRSLQERPLLTLQFQIHTSYHGKFPFWPSTSHSWTFCLNPQVHTRDTICTKNNHTGFLWPTSTSAFLMKITNEIQMKSISHECWPEINRGKNRLIW